MMGRWCLLLGAVVLAGGACHTYTPVEAPVPGTIVRVHVPVRSAISNPNAPPQTVSVEGQVLSASDTIALATRIRQQAGLFREIVQYDTLRLTIDDLAGMEVREFSTARSLVLTGVILGGATGLALAALSIETGSTGDDGGPGGPVTSVVVTDVAGMIWGWFAGAR